MSGWCGSLRECRQANLARRPAPIRMATRSSCSSEQKIGRDHPELVDYLDAVMQTVAKPDHVEPDVLPARTRFYRRDVGPSRWLMAVVSYEQQPARIITALANRKDPRRWKP
jgi:hypothetical protein